MLTAEQVDRYRHDGYLFPFPALSSDEIAIVSKNRQFC
jgi:hypothetical protein